MSEVYGKTLGLSENSLIKFIWGLLKNLSKIKKMKKKSFTVIRILKQLLHYRQRFLTVVSYIYKLR